MKHVFPGRESQKKVLVSAYSCEPNRGSEPGVGWHWVQAIAKNAQAWVITKGSHKIAIQNELRKGPHKGLHFEFVDLPRWMNFLKKGEAGARIYYYLWQFAALTKARILLRSIEFDLAHHVTFVNDWVWTFLSLLPIPFIWGPIGSNPKLPRQLFGDRRHQLFDLLKSLFQSSIRLMDPLYWISAWRAAKIICINNSVPRNLPLRILARDKIVIEPAIAIEELPINAHRNTKDAGKANKTFSILFMGQFIAIKNPDIALEAFAEFVSKIPESRLTMVGEGPLLQKLRRQTIKLNIIEKVKFVKWLPRKKALRLFQEHNVFLFPSMEGGGMVVLEAIASGIPVVCLEFGGPGQMVTPEVGFKIKVSSRSKVIREIAQTLNIISQDGTWGDEARRARIIQIARSKFSWGAKEHLISRLYHEINYKKY